MGKRLAFLLPDMRGGGAERVALRLIEDFLAAGHDVDLVLMEARGELLPLVPPTVRIVDLRALRIRSVIKPLRRYFRERKPHAMQISMWPLTVAGIIAHRLARSKARVVLSDHIVLTKQYGHFGRAGLQLMRASLRHFYPLADARILVSHQAADDLSKLSGIARDRIEVIYNPVGKPPANLAPDTAIEALWGAETGRIITVGTLKEQKNHALLIRSFARLLQRRPAKLMILGEGPLRPELDKLATEMGVAEHVILPGFSTDPWPYFASADLFALSSDYEGYPLVLIEAMRSGLPIVSTDCESGPREILRDGQYGMLVEVGSAEAMTDALERGLDARLNPATQRARAEEISGQDTSDRYLQLMLGSS